MTFDRSATRDALAGISGILVTPFDEEGELAPERLRPIVDRVLAVGKIAPVINGNTSEFYALTVEEAERMVRAAAEHVAGRAPVIAGVGRGIRDACRLARTSVRAGASALMVHQPPDPFVSPRGIVDYLRWIGDAADGIPLVLYLRNDAIGTARIADLCAVDGVIGIKWATPNPLRLAEAISVCPPDIAWVGGLAEPWAPVFYAVGARGFTSGLVNVWPERSLAIYEALEAEDHARASSLVAGIRVFETLRAEEQGGTNVSVVKAALRMIGHDCGSARPPSAWPLDGSQQARLEAFVRSSGLIE